MVSGGPSAPGGHFATEPPEGQAAVARALGSGRSGTAWDPFPWALRMGVVFAAVGALLAVLGWIDWIETPSASGDVASSWLPVPAWIEVELLLCSLAALLLLVRIRLAAIAVFGIAGLIITAVSVGLMFGLDLRAVAGSVGPPDVASAESVVVLILIIAAGILSASRMKFGAVVGGLLAATGVIAMSAVVSHVYDAPESIGGLPQPVAMPVPAALSAVAITLSIAMARPGLRPLSYLAQPSVLLTVAGLVGLILSVPALFAVSTATARGLGLANPSQWGTATALTVVIGVLSVWGAVTARRREWQRYTDIAAESVLIVSPEGAVLEANDRAAELLGCSMVELRGSTVEDWIPAKSRERHRRLREEYLVTPTDRPMEVRGANVRRADGSEFIADIWLHPVQGGLGRFVVVSIKDVTPYVRAQRERDEAQSLLAEATGQAPIGQAVLGLDGSFLQVNQAYERITGYPADELIGRTFHSITNPADVDVDVEQRSELVSGSRDRYAVTKRISRSDGSTVWLELHMGAVRDPAGVLTALTAQAIDISSQKQAEAAMQAALASLAYRSTHDVLTGLANRRELLDGLASWLATRSGVDSERLVAVLYCDLDDFKYVNDAISHAAGDQVLIEVSRRLRAAVRGTDLVARLGGDEFVVVLQGVRSAEEALRVASMIQEQVCSRVFEAAERKVRVGISVGIALSRRGSDADAMVREADAALRRAKAAGRGLREVFDSAMREESSRRLTLAEELRTASRLGQISAWFQPIVELKTRGVVGYEALARWEQPNGQVIPAAEWIDVAEQHGLLSEIGETVFDAAFALLRTLPAPQWVSVNVSSSQLADPSCAGSLLERMRSNGIDATRLAVEVQEHVVLKSPVVARGTLESLFDNGVRILFDCFGTGYSSLTHLRTLPVSGIKLDRSFTQVADQYSDLSNPALQLASALADFVGKLGLDRIAEGIEDSAQERLLSECGWTYGQGWLYGRPAPLRA